MKSISAQTSISLVSCAMLFALCLDVKAQQLGKVRRIAYLTAASPSAMATWTEAFREGLRDFGYVEGKNIIIEWRSAEGKAAGLPGLAAELVRLNVAVIVTEAQHQPVLPKTQLVQFPLS